MRLVMISIFGFLFEQGGNWQYRFLLFTLLVNLLHTNYGKCDNVRAEYLGRVTYSASSSKKKTSIVCMGANQAFAERVTRFLKTYGTIL